MKVSRKVAIYLLACSMLMWQSTAALAATGNSNGKGQGGKAPAVTASTTATTTEESAEPAPAPECAAPAEGEAPAEGAACTVEEQPSESASPAPAPAPATGKGKANVDLTGKGKAAEKNPNIGADGRLQPGTAAMTKAEAEEQVAAVKAESRLEAKAERAKGEKGAYLVYVNGKRLNLTPVARSGRTLVPFRALAENLGATVDWVQATRTVIMTRGDVTVELSIGSGIAKINGEEVELQTPPELIEGSTFVPLRFLAEALGADVDYDPETGAITVITLPGYVEPGEGEEDDATEGDDEATEGDDDATEGDGDAAEGDDDATEGGDGATEGGDDATEGGDDATEGGDDATEGGDDATEGNGGN